MVNLALLLSLGFQVTALSKCVHFIWKCARRWRGEDSFLLSEILWSSWRVEIIIENVTITSRNLVYNFLSSIYETSSVGRECYDFLNFRRLILFRVQWNDGAKVIHQVFEGWCKRKASIFASIVVRKMFLRTIYNIFEKKSIFSCPPFLHDVKIFYNETSNTLWKWRLWDLKWAEVYYCTISFHKIRTINIQISKCQSDSLYFTRKFCTYSNSN